MNWKERAIKCLNESLYPVPSERNEIDWKSGLSSKTDRLAQHLCAFSNLEGGGFLVYGVNDDASLFSVTKEQNDEVIKKLGNIARHNLIPSVALEHTTLDFNGNSLLFIHIPGNTEKPVYMRNGTIYDSYCRSAG
jgi:predicted HTH transcriptional regulator